MEVGTQQQEKPPQLRMVFRPGAFTPQLPLLGEEFELRPATPDNVAGLAALLSLAYGYEWSEERVRDVLLDNSSVPTTWVITHAESLVATASYLQQYSKFPGTGWVHYVAADPDYKGKGLGSIVTWAVVEESLSSGDSDVRLNTDDWRLPAIVTYLRLGFKPEPWHASHAERWAAAMEKLA